MSREPRSDHVDAISIESFESERRQSLAESVDNRSIEINRNQVIYSNLRNGNPCQPSIQHSGYCTPPQTVFSKLNLIGCRSFENLEFQVTELTTTCHIEILTMTANVALCHKTAFAQCYQENRCSYQDTNPRTATSNSPPTETFSSRRMGRFGLPQGHQKMVTALPKLTALRPSRRCSQ